MSEITSTVGTAPRAALAPIAAPKPALSVLDAVMITVGIVIGAGIFKTPSLVAGITGSVDWMLIAWILGGVLSLIGALCYAELASTFPHAGGDYHFITRAYGRDVSFFFAWARVSVITTGSVALLSFVFGDYMTRVVSLGPHSSALYAALTVVVLTVINLIGLRESARTQNLLTALEVGGVLLVALAGWMAGPPAATAAPAAAAPGGVPAMFGLAMVFVLLTYGGWNEAAYISAEVKGGPRAIVRALVLALLIITVAYILFVLAVLNGLGFAGMAKSTAVGADVMQAAFGPIGVQVIGVIVGIATLTSINATMIVGARTNYALGRDWPILAFMSQWHGGEERAGDRLSRAGRHRPWADCFWSRAEGRIFGDGRVHRAGVLVLLPADGSGTGRSALPRTACGPPVQGAGLPDLADRLHRNLRIPAVFEHHLCALAECSPCGPLRDARGRRGLARNARHGGPPQRRTMITARTLHDFDNREVSQ